MIWPSRPGSRKPVATLAEPLMGMAATSIARTGMANNIAPTLSVRITTRRTSSRRMRTAAASLPCSEKTRGMYVVVASSNPKATM